MLNKVEIIGHLGRDPEIRSTQSGGRIANLSVATSEHWKDKNTGERKERTEWHRVVIFNEGLVKVIEAYLKKGSMVYIEGSLQTRKWTDNDGKDRYSTEIVLQPYNGVLKMLDGKSNGARRGEASQSDSYEADYNAGNNRASSSKGIRDDLDDDIPF